MLIGGGSGLIGSRLTRLLLKKGYQVAWLSRSGDHKTSFRVYHWDVEAGKIEQEAIARADHVINLAGAGIASKSWSEERKMHLINSRVKSNLLLQQTAKKMAVPLKTFISASAAGYYGHRDDEILTEESPPSDDFLGRCCRKWEQAADTFTELGVRTVKIRTGIVLSTEGGALPSIEKPVKMGLGAPLGKGDQWVSWIHLDDVCRMYIHAIEHTAMNGSYNAAAPHPVSNATLTRTLASTLKKPLWLPNVPAFTIKAMIGQRAHLVLDSARLSDRKILQSGFKFRYPTLEEAFGDLYD